MAASKKSISKKSLISALFLGAAFVLPAQAAQPIAENPEAADRMESLAERQTRQANNKLMHAVRAGRLDTAEFLIDNGVDVKKLNQHSVDKMLRNSVFSGNTDMIKFCQRAGMVQDQRAYRVLKSAVYHVEQSKSFYPEAAKALPEIKAMIEEVNPVQGKKSAPAAPSP